MEVIIIRVVLPKVEVNVTKTKMRPMRFAGHIEDSGNPTVTITSKPLGPAQDQNSDQESFKCFHGHIEGNGRSPKPVYLPSRNTPISQIQRLPESQAGYTLPSP